MGARQATEIARQAAEIATLKESAGEQKAPPTPQDTVDEPTGIVTASGAFCAVRERDTTVSSQDQGGIRRLSLLMGPQTRFPPLKVYLC